MNTISETPASVKQVLSLQERFAAQKPIVLQEPEWLQPRARAPFKVAAPVARVYDTRPMPEVRESLQQALREYLAVSSPNYILLLKPPPGTGKTYAGVSFTHYAYKTTNHRVAYMGPRHSFYTDIQEAVTQQGEDANKWYEWQTRQDGAKGKTETCKHADAMRPWQIAGYDSMDFCTQMCQWKYINNECSYHAQKRRQEPIFYLQHQHLTMGHPNAEKFGVIIVDEDPIDVFYKEWIIKGGRILPSYMEWGDLLTQPLTILRDVAEHQTGNVPLCGVKLYEEFQRALQAKGHDIAFAIEACEGFPIRVGGKVIAPEIEKPEDAERVSPNYLPDFVPMFLRELRAFVAGEEFAPRIHLHNDAIKFDAKRPVNASWHAEDKHVVCFDGTGDPDLYETVFDRKVETYDVRLPIKGRIFQVYDRANGVGALTNATSNEDATKVANRSAHAELRLVQRLVREHGYKRPVVITFQAIEGIFKAAGFETAHFGGQRGTNSFVECDAAFIIGAYMPPRDQLERKARRLWPDVQSFNTTWITVEREYGVTAKTGDGVAFEVSQYADDRLNLLLFAARESEIEQAAHRVRPIFRDADVWLFTNIPLFNMPPSRLVTRRDLYGAPNDVNLEYWDRVTTLAGELIAQRGYVTLGDLVTGTGLDRDIISKYMDHMMVSGMYDKALADVLPKQKGQKPKAIMAPQGE